MKIGLICNEYPPAMCGGIGVFTKELANGLVNAGHQVTVVGVYQDLEKEICEQLDQVTVYRLPAKTGRVSPWVNSRILFNQVRKLAMAKQIDLIEVPDFEGNAAFWGKLPIPVVVRIHGTVTYFSDEMGTKISELVRWLERRTLQRAQHLLAVTQYVADHTMRLFGVSKPTTIVHNGVKLPEATLTKTDFSYQGKAVFTGSLMRKKGSLSLAKAWNIVQQKFPDATLVLIGKDTQEAGQSIKEKMIELAGKQAKLEFTGHVTKAQLQERMSLADLGVFPSYSESFGLAPFEAMALGVPTIYTKLSCGPELLRDQQDAILVDPDNIEEIADAITTLFEQQEQRQRYSDAGKKRVLEFSVEHQLAKNISAYQSLIARDS